MDFDDETQTDTATQHGDTDQRETAAHTNHHNAIIDHDTDTDKSDIDIESTRDPDMQYLYPVIETTPYTTIDHRKDHDKVTADKKCQPYSCLISGMMVESYYYVSPLFFRTEEEVM